MYYLDPRLGHRRRSVARDRLKHFGRQAAKNFGKLSRDVSYRIRGVFHKAGNRILPSHPSIPENHILEARVRSKIGRIMNHEPRTFDVHADQGEITLLGQVNDALYQRLNKKIRNVPGVLRVRRVQISGQKVA
jgi:hypothetical protein